MQVITEQQGRILQAIARYKFLSALQLARLGIGEITGIRERIKGIATAQKPLLGCIKFGVHPIQGRLPYVYYLTPHGQTVLMENFEMEQGQIKMPIGESSLFYKDYMHRKHTIDYQISLYLWSEKAGFEIEFFDTYFDKIGNNRRDKNSQSKNKIFIGEELYIIPDGVYILKKETERHLHLFEMYNGKDTKRVLGQLAKHGITYELGSPSTKYDIPKAHRTVLVFEYESIKQAVIHRAKEDDYFTDISKFFKLHSLEKMTDDFMSGWVNLHGQSTSFL
jgi:hypothetical protein